MERIEMKSICLSLSLPGTGRGTIRRMVEGGRYKRCDCSDDAIQIAENIVRGESHNAMAVLRQESVSPGVEIGPVAALMRLTIDLDRQPGRATIEIDHIRPDGVALAKLRAEFASPDLIPEPHFGQRHLASETAGQ